MKQIRLGTIGTGFIVNNILNGVKAVVGISLEAVYSRSEKRAEFLPGSMGQKKYIRNWKSFCLMRK